MRNKLTGEQLERLEGRCDARCEICGEPQRPTRKLCVDHDHETGNVRGLLCHNCNLGLGAFQDRILLLISAIEYLQQRPAIAAKRVEVRPLATRAQRRLAERKAWWASP